MNSRHYIIIGAMKSGTTSLHEILSRNSPVAMSRFKEPNFFNTYFHKGLDWYRKLFPADADVTADASPNYAKCHRWPDTARFMYETFPNARLIYVVRDPVDRIVSHLHHDIHRDRINPKRVEEALLQDEEYIMTSSYHYQIQHFLKYYPQESILIIPFEWLRDKPEFFMAKITDFMNIEKIALGDHRKFYSSESKYFIKSFDWAKSKLPPAVRKYYHALFHLLSIKYPKPELQPATTIIVKNRLETDIAEFKKLTNYQFPEWKAYDAIGRSAG